MKLISFALKLFLLLSLSVGTAHATTIDFELPAPQLPKKPNRQMISLLEMLEFSLSQPEDCGRFKNNIYKCRKVNVKRAKPGGESMVEYFKISRGTPALIIPPYPAPIPGVSEYGLFQLPHVDNTIIARGLGSGNYEWVELKEVIDGAKLLEDWRRRASVGEVVACHLESCQRLVLAWSKIKKGRVKGVAICSVKRLGSGYTAPILCEYIAIELHNMMYIRALTHYLDHVYAMAGRKDFSVVLGQGIGLSGFLEGVALRLTEKPFLAEVALEKETVVASADFQYFEPLNMFALFTITVSKGGIVGESNEPVVDVITTLYLSPRTSQAAKEWSMPSAPENSTFIRVLRNRIISLSSSICSKSANTSDSDRWHRISCASVP